MKQITLLKLSVILLLFVSCALGFESARLNRLRTFEHSVFLSLLPRSKNKGMERFNIQVMEAERRFGAPIEIISFESGIDLGLSVPHMTLLVRRKTGTYRETIIGFPQPSSLNIRPQ